MVTNSPRDYEALALDLARDPARLAAIRSRLCAGRQNLPLFDMAKRTRDLEALYARMAEIWRCGQPATPTAL
jgi:predicted O-linked N-acetylglucosamine transferase (SPINDLY family)